MHQIMLFYFLAFVCIHANLKIRTLLIAFVITPHIEKWQTTVYLGCSVTNRTEKTKEKEKSVTWFCIFMFYSSLHKEIHHVARTSRT
jgi:hypothetical protein